MLMYTKIIIIVNLSANTCSLKQKFICFIIPKMYDIIDIYRNSVGFHKPINNILYDTLRLYNLKYLTFFK